MTLDTWPRVRAPLKVGARRPFLNLDVDVNSRVASEDLIMKWQVGKDVATDDSRNEAALESNSALHTANLKLAFEEYYQRGWWW